MHGRGRISEATRAKVLRGIQELGYTPNINAQRLAVGRTYMVVLDFGNWTNALADMFFVELTRYVQESLEARGYGLLLNTRRDVLCQWARSRALDGVILVRGGAPEPEMPREIAVTGTPCVVIGHHPLDRSSGLGSVVVGLRNGVEQVARLLVEKGHRRIGFLANEEPDDVVLASFREELARLGFPLEEKYLVQAGSTLEDGFRGLNTLLARSDPPTAVFMRSDSLALGALRAAYVRGISVPGELSLVGHDDVPFVRLAHPPLTTVDVQCAGLARTATQMLFELMERPADSPEHEVVPTELVIRETVAKPHMSDGEAEENDSDVH